jgi:L-cysteate sulfo-lyase
MHLDDFPRLRLAHLPTPLERLDRLSDALGGPRIYIKRDDCTGLAFGGNKARKLEFLLADAVRGGADTVLTSGALQSNHARQTVAAAAHLGLAAEVVLEDRVVTDSEDYRRSGNLFLDGLCGARVHICPPGGVDSAISALAVDIRARGRTPYVIPGGGSNPVGTLGYVNAALELLVQAEDARVDVARVVHATSSAGTQAGLLVGLRARNNPMPVLGFSVQDARDSQEERVFELARRSAEHTGHDGCVSREDVVVSADFIGTGYGRATPGMRAAVELVARCEGILLDPVYTGKAMAGLIEFIRNGAFHRKENVVFLHTGGTPALFAYQGAFRN